MGDHARCDAVDIDLIKTAKKHWSVQFAKKVEATTESHKEWQRRENELHEMAK